MKKLITLILTTLTFTAFASNDVPVTDVENTSRGSQQSMVAGIILNDDHATDEVKLETTFTDRGLIQVRTSNGSGNEQVFTQDYASQKELDQATSQTRQSLQVVQQQQGAFTTYSIKRMTKAEKELYATTRQTQANTRRMQYHDKRITANTKEIARAHTRIDVLREDMYQGVASAMAIGNLPQAPNNKWGLSASAGNYGGKNALALGLSGTMNNKLTVKVGVTYDNVEVGSAISLGYWY